jgi:hypothetical protein
MVHERKLDKQLHINGPLTTCIATVTAALHEIEASIAIQNEGFENLIRGSKVGIDDVLRRAHGNWYIEANEAKSLGLVAEVPVSASPAPSRLPHRRVAPTACNAPIAPHLTIHLDGVGMSCGWKGAQASGEAFG